MDPRLGTRGSNDLRGATFKGKHVRVLFRAITSYISHFNGSPAFLIRQKGEKESKCEDQAQEQASLHQIYKARSSRKSYTKGALVFATFVSFICFRILFVIIKKGEIVGTLSRTLAYLVVCPQPSLSFDMTNSL